MSVLLPIKNPTGFKHFIKAFSPLAWDATLGYKPATNLLVFSSLSSTLSLSLECQIAHSETLSPLSPPNPPLTIDVKKLACHLRSVSPSDQLYFSLVHKHDKLFFCLTLKSAKDLKCTFSLPLWKSENAASVLPQEQEAAPCVTCSVDFKMLQATIGHHLTVARTTELYCSALTGELVFETKCQETSTSALSRLPKLQKCVLKDRHKSGGLRSHPLGTFSLSALRALAMFGSQPHAPTIHLTDSETSSLLYFSNKPESSEDWRLRACLPPLEPSEAYIFEPYSKDRPDSPPFPEGAKTPPPIPTPLLETTTTKIRRKKRKKNSKPKTKPGLIKPKVVTPRPTLQEIQDKYRATVYCKVSKKHHLPGHELAPVMPNQEHNEMVQESHKSYCQHNWCAYVLDRPENDTHESLEKFNQAWSDMAADATVEGTYESLKNWLWRWDMWDGIRSETF